MSNPRSFAFVFVCQAGELEVKAALLAASLKRYLLCPCELVAAVPGPAGIWGSPSGATVEFLAGLGVRFAGAVNSIDLSYPIANKIDCLRVKTAADKLVFLDSDMLLMREFGDEPRFGVAFNARPASTATFAREDAAWERIHRICDAPLPMARIRTTYSGEYTLPYFNAAFIAVPGASGFGDVWLECCKRIDADPAVPNKRPYLDQIALGVAAAKLGLAMDALDERYNHPINFKPMDELNLPFFCHYHDVPTLTREPAAVELVRSLVAEYPALRGILRQHPGWEKLANAQPIARRTKVTPELIITGIPRSGTSYLCNLLHRLDNCVVINEPVEAPLALMEESKPFGVARLFRDIRRDILAGKPIRNKLKDGAVTEDTSVAGEVGWYTPKVAAGDFVLGIKATVAFLSRLPALRTVMPNARFVACVRNPIDTIASWKSTFAHLANANVEGVNVGNSSDPWITGMQRRELIAIAAIPDAASRRAAWWRYLADLILESRDQLVLIRYEDLVRKPRDILREIIGDWPAGEARETIEPSTARRRREILDGDDLAAIRGLCADSARKLGIDLFE
jgi:hypothetical protein